ncbi:ABC transporter permease [bacterium M00.F.Ca.ET.141.01.1.1]|uniref:ABC transporter permease n=1 Tax=unclassified Mesorhizobium TaxID=325217 RepID=UPI001091FB78|nr:MULTISPECIES: ABC transporter permease [unclassified Mesorhizobium]TGV56820.1 ABC transporter permease [bacterium M00.F.Ca.ET.141.01.1.1]TIS99679.1 MAG: ABC transporter permease [Mesorhizobium sp.]TGP92988.1 ABC transporter permease [Mesorhizobium sp. M8A.F.Ca.ET.218.01.1.1]TGS43220.1 ABC transporter permease [Mesorhizobium sp. M8A.F.Ca.ET.182.01.1.1]TGS80223.1 ABC transporter permease [Mesorhizobium sp. M8A.F.Ca.ET.181.01.1.1]
MFPNLRGLIFPLVRREVTGRYRGSAFGLAWSLLNPLFMLAVYTFVFGVVMKSRWTIPGQQGATDSTGEYAVVLFCGLIVFQFFAEVVSLAPGLIVANANYVKKIVFPIQILPLVSAGAALFHAAVSLLVLLVFAFIVFGYIPATVVLAPLVFAPLVVMVLGIAWILASIGVYFRDMSQIVAPLVTATMFLSPVFFQRTSLPIWLQPWLSLNPLAIPVESFRDVVLFDIEPDWLALGSYLLAAIAVAFLGYQFFQKTRRGFADVL